MLGLSYSTSRGCVMKLVNVSQRTPEWQRWRAQGISASEVAIIMGRSHYKTPWRLWAEKTGRVLPQNLDNHPLIRIGIDSEPLAIQRFEEKHGGCCYRFAVNQNSIHCCVPRLTAYLKPMNR